MSGYFGDIAPSDDCQEFTSFAGADIPIKGRHIEVVDAGAGTKKLVVTTAAGVDRTLTVYNGWRNDLKITAIKGGGVTTVACVQVSG